MQLFQENIHFHNSLKSLHEHVDPEALPEEYGGTAGPFENSNCEKAILVCDKTKAARWQNVFPSFPRKGRNQILHRSVLEP